MMEVRSRDEQFITYKKIDFKFSLKQKLEISHSIASALKYLHDMNIIHRDLKSQNLFLGKDLKICLADLGISRVRSVRMTKGMGTPRYMAPELLQGNSYSEKADVYSFGILLWELFHEVVPFIEIQHSWFSFIIIIVVIIIIIIYKYYYLLLFIIIFIFIIIIIFINKYLLLLIFILSCD